MYDDNMMNNNFEPQNGNFQPHQQPSPIAIASLVLGIVGIIVGLVANAYVGLICGIVGIVLGSKARKETPSPMADGGFICSIVSTCISGAAIVCALCALGTLVSLFA